MLNAVGINFFFSERIGNRRSQGYQFYEILI